MDDTHIYLTDASRVWSFRQNLMIAIMLSLISANATCYVWWMVGGGLIQRSI